MPPNTVKVDRSTRWGNHIRVFGEATPQQAVDGFRHSLIADREKIAAARLALRGRDLACWCGLDDPCHADVWLEIVNS